MSLLKRIFKAPAPTLQNRIEALDACATEQLMDICLSDESESLREAAVGRLPYTQTLRDLATDAGSSRVRLAARKRIGQLLEEDHLELAQLSRDLNDDHQLLALASYSPSASLSVLEQINDPAILLQQAAQGATTQIRQAAADKLDDRPNLEQLLKAAQGKDKNVYRIAKAKLDAFKAEDARLADIARRATELCVKIEILSRLDTDPLFSARLGNLESEWATLVADVPDEVAQRYQKALAFCRQTLDQQEQALAAEEQRAAQVRQASQTVRTASAAIENLVNEICACTDVSLLTDGNYGQQLHNLNASVSAACEISDSKLPATEFDRFYQASLALLETLQRTGPLPELIVRLDTSDDASERENAANALTQALETFAAIPQQLKPTALQTAQASLDQWREQQQQQARQQKDALRQVSELCRRGLRAAEQGHVRQARGVYKELLEKIEPLAPLAQALQAKVDALAAAIEKLSDWHNFAVTPKKQALVAEMQSLANSKLPSDDLADRIHQLQEDWKELSRGVQQQDEELWQAFQEAAHIAYEPCKVFFEAQAEERERNLAKREHLIEQVRSYLRDYAWENAVWKDVEQTLKVARQEWQTSWPVPRKTSATLQKTFDSLMEELHGKLSAAYQASKDKKAALVTRAQQLLEQADLHQATEQAKQLQQQWQSVGRTWTRDEQALWKSFRKVCDEIFARRKAEYDNARSERAAQEQQAENLLAKLAALQELTGQALIDARADAAAIKAEFEQLGELPHASAKRLTGRLHASLEAINDKAENERKAARQQSWDALLDASDRVRLAELALLAGKDDALVQAQAALDQVSQWPQGSRELLEQRLKNAPALTAEQQSASEEALRLLCIRAEIMSNTETPESDRNRRMAYQVEQLQRGMGQGRREESIEALILEWVTHGAVASDTYLELLARLNRCRGNA